ncbi:MAG: hypothetical protein HN929_09505 [Chloroflexi bacterium]|jgi:hypothetical protein|nr:hypothetical protein [Chloroflexota bacterium]MBT7081684.1 hypothetical protein [Chloroflexota bacterium]
MTCYQVTGVAKAMKEKFGEKLELNVYTNDSKEAELVSLTASSTVFVNDGWISLDIAKSKEKMQELLNKQICV